MHRRFRKVFCALKEHSAVSHSKIATVGGFCDIVHIIVKSTAPDDLPLSEKYFHELLSIFAISPSSFHSFSISFTRRFGKTHSWKVALRCLLLLHRLLRSLPENSPFRNQLLWTRSRGFLCLYPCKFLYQSSSTPKDYTLFIRCYAHLLDEALDCFSLESKAIEDQEGDEEEVSLQYKMKRVGTLLEFLPQLQSLIDRVMDCRPTGIAAKSFIVQSATKRIICDSFICYTTFRKEIILVLDNMLQMPYGSSILAFGIYKKAALQTNQLCEFYEWCKAKGLCGSYEYPFIDRIPQIQIRAMEAFLDGMWQLTDQSATSNTASPSSLSRSRCEEDHGDNKKVLGRDVAVSTQWVKFEETNNTSRKNEDEEDIMAPLIRFEDDENDNWEALLDASLHHIQLVPQDNLLICSLAAVHACGDGNRFYGISSSCSGLGDRYGYRNGFYEEDKYAELEENDEWKGQVYNPNIANVFNPFCQPWNGNMPRCNGLSATHPTNQRV